MRRSRLTRALAVVAVLVAACGSRDGAGETSAGTSPPPRYSAQVASFDFAAGSPQSFLLGLIGPNQESVVNGTVEITFAYLGRTRATGRRQSGPAAVGSFVPVPGQPTDPDADGPVLADPERSRGVYRTEPVTLEEPGLWEASAAFRVGGQRRSATAAFTVATEHQIPFVGDRAPATEQALAGASGVPAAAIDSRASDDKPFPDPGLHRVTIAESLRRGRPMMIVIATPTYCMSRFCGPVTDAVARLAATYPDADFAHLEIWADHEAQRLNPWVSDWIVPRGGGPGAEPWVFVVDREGIITERFDNVASDAMLELALQRVV